MSKSRPNSSTTTGTVRTTTETTTTKAGAPANAIQDEDEFEFETGDRYVGWFEAKKKEKTVKMCGKGTYTSAQGDSYTGVWLNDQLVNKQTILANYPDGSSFEGPIENWKYSGEGKYTYGDGTVLTGKFGNNCPQGDLELVDPNGHKWLGTAQKGFAWFNPANHYYEALEAKDQRKRKRKVTRDVQK